MKRLPFKTEHEESVKNGTKEFTSRWGSPIEGHQGYKVGDVVACVAPRLGKHGKLLPAFLVAAGRAFCHAEILEVIDKKWSDFTEEDARFCGVTRDWYLAHSAPQVPDENYITTYRFRVVKELVS